MRKLTVVVTCTQRKSVPSPSHLQVRSLPRGATRARSTEWLRRLKRPAAQTPLVNLYQGEAWTCVKNLVSTGQAHGYAVNLLVASAGLGLRDATSLASGYGATFTRGHQDTVATSNTDASDWWALLREAPFALDPASSMRGRVLLFLSDTYSNAMEADLNAMADRSVDALVVGGHTGIVGIPRLPADMTLRRTLGGTATSINLRMATHWLSVSQGEDLYSAAKHERWRAWARTTALKEIYDRQIMTDSQVRDFVAQMLLNDPSISATQSLSLLRGSGRACEQRRFHRLFHELKDKP